MAKRYRRRSSRSYSPRRRRTTTRRRSYSARPQTVRIEIAQPVNPGVMTPQGPMVPATPTNRGRF